jgi:HSP20 family protein
MTIIRRTSPFGELMTLRRAMDRLFDEDVFRPFQWTPGLLESRPLPLDATTSKDALRIEASLPGVKPEDVTITVENGVLTITGRTAEEQRTEGDSYLVQELRRGQVSRSLTLPDGLEPDKATATFEHGMLTLVIPKAEEVKPRQIRISPLTEGAPAVAAEASKR